MPTNTSRDSSIFKDQLVKVYQPDGVTYIDTIKDAPYITYQDQINASRGSIQMTLPRPIDAYDGFNMPNSQGTMVLGNVVKVYLFGPALPASGLLKYQGIIDTIMPKIDDKGGESVQITITPFGQILGDHGIIGPINYGTPNSSGTYVDSGTIFSNLLTTTDSTTGQAYGYPFTLDPGNPATTGVSVQATFQNQTLLSALTTILLLSPSNYFFRMNADKTITFNTYPTTPNYILRIGQHITSMEYSLDNVPRKNVIVVQGKGVMAKAVGSSVSQIGQRIYFKSDNRITDTNTAQLLANGLLAFYDRQQIRTKIKIPDYRGDLQSGIGYDIEQFKVGQTVKIEDMKAPLLAVSNTAGIWGRFKYGTGTWGTTAAQLAVWGLFKWGQTNWGFGVGTVFNTVVPIVAVNYGFHFVELELGFRQPSMNRALYNLESRFQDATLVS